MHRLSYEGLPLPELYVCDSRREARACLEAGISCIVTSMPDEDIVKLVLYRTLRRKFPHIRWDRIIRLRPAVGELVVMVPGGDAGDSDAFSDGDSGRADVAIESRVFGGTDTNTGSHHIETSIDDFCQEEISHVNVEQLQALGMLPRFMSDAADAIRVNMEDRLRWQDGWNKRLGACVGTAGYGHEAPNLIILDISGSIPRGISYTMLQLIATLQSQTSADLIVTGSRSMFWSHDEELPDPDWLRDSIGLSNERTMFFKILRDHVAGRHFGNVISFGDWDTPFERDMSNMPRLDGTIVDRVVHYHTTEKNPTGYARWCREVSPDCEEVIDTSWCEVMVR